MTSKILIFFPHLMEERHGGPGTYLYNLRKSIVSETTCIHFLNELITLPSSPTPIPLKSRYIQWIKEVLSGTLLNSFRAFRYLLLMRKGSKLHFDALKQINYDEYRIIHFHSPLDLWIYSSLLIDFKGQLLLTSHSPVPFHTEFPLESFGLHQQKVNSLLAKYLERIDKFSFDRADAIVQPHENSMEGYDLWNHFKTIKKNKEFLNIMTGAPQLVASTAPEIIRNRYNIPEGSFLVCFNGRHSYYKGFDLFIKAAIRLLPLNDEIWFIATGRKTPGETITHPRWIETGWIDLPGDIVNASNLVVVPNRESYFDLNVIECLSMGKFLLIAKNGGHTFFDAVTPNDGIKLFDNNSVDALVEGILSCLDQRQELELRGEQNMQLYSHHFTLEDFGKKYLEMYERLSSNN